MKTRKTKAVKIIAMILSAITLCLSLTPLSAFAASAPSDYDAEQALLYCFNTESILYEKNSETPTAPATTAQMMTALLALEHFPDMTQEVTLEPDMLTSWSATGDYRAPADYGFIRNATLPVGDLFAALVLENANSAALLLAALISGSHEAFVETMNDRAAALGMVNTTYQNATGTDAAGASTTPRDVLLLARTLYREKRYTDLVASPSYALQNNSFRIYTRNYFVGTWYSTLYYDSKVTGMHAGQSESAGYTVVASSTEDNGYSYLAVVMGGKTTVYNTNGAYSVAKSLLRWGGTNFSYRKVLSKAELVTALPVKKGGSTKSVPIFPKEDVTAYLAKDVELDQISYETTFRTQTLTAPFEKGTEVGEIEIYLNGEKIGVCPLVTGADVAKGRDAIFREFLGKFFTNPIVIIALIFVCLLILRKILIYRRRLKKRRMKEQKQLK